MLHTRRSNIVPIIVIIVFVFATLHILNAGPTAIDVADVAEKSTSTWKSWAGGWTGAEDIREKDKDGGRWDDSKAASDEQKTIEESAGVGSKLTSTSSASAHATPTPAKTAEAEKPKEESPKKEESAPKAEETPTCSGTKAWKSLPLSATNGTFSVADDIVYDPKGPRPDQVIILTATDGGGHNGGIENIVERAMRNRKEYCAYQGYRHHFVNISRFDMDGAHPVWKKLPAIVDAFNTYPDAQWVWMLDLDAIVMTPTNDLVKTILSEDGMRRNLELNTEFHAGNRKALGIYTAKEADYQNVDMLIAQDHNGVNAGSFFIRRSKFSQFLIDMWADPMFRKMDWPGQEQDTVLHFVKHHYVFRQHLGVMKQRVANAFSEGDDTMRWQDGDLLVHFAGCWVNGKCAERWEEFWNKRETVDVEVEDDSTDDGSASRGASSEESASYAEAR